MQKTSKKNLNILLIWVLCDAICTSSYCSFCSMEALKCVTHDKKNPYIIRNWPVEITQKHSHVKS